MRNTNGRLGIAVALAFALSMPVAAAEHGAAALDAWQGQGQGQGQARGNGGDNGRGQGRDDDARGQAQGNQGRGNSGEARAQGNQGRGNSGEAATRGNQGGRNEGPAARGNSGAAGNRGALRRARTRPEAAAMRAQIDRLPENVRRMRSSSRRGDRVVAGALTFASLRGTSPDRFRVETRDDRWVVRNDRNDVLLDMDERRARELGHWEMRRLGDRRPNENSPAFCRSGAGHPVWGREWCLEKGFGLGVSDRNIWSRTADTDVVFRRRPTTEVVDRGGLLDVLGDIVFGRLAVQSLALGYDAPLTGRWVASNERDAPFVLQVHAGDYAVAELVDSDRDDDVDVLFVSQPRW